MFLGRGTYGSVSVRDGLAYKKFHKLSHMVQEYIAMKYLDDCKYTVKATSVDIPNLEIGMELYDMSLRDWMNKHPGPKATHENKMKLLHDILCGLVELHERGLVHGDIKPGNILVKCQPLKCVLGDLGFVSVARYAKVERTAAVYRDTIIDHSYAHDIYSLGVIMLEMFGNLKIRIQADYDQLREISESEISNKKMCKLILAMVQKNHQKRPRAKDILHKLFDKTMDIRLPEMADISNIISIRRQDEIENLIKTAAKLHDIKRCKRSLGALLCYLNKMRPNKKSYHLCTVTMVMIASALFGKSGFTEDHVLKACRGKYSMHELYIVLNSMINDRDVIIALLLP